MKGRCLQLELSKYMANDFEMMKAIADEDMSAQTQFDIEKAQNTCKMFLVADAKRTLKQIIKLNEFLDKVQQKYTNKVINNIEHYDEAEFHKIMNMIITLLEYANDRVQQIIKDDSLSNLLFIDNSTTQTTIGTQNALNLGTPDSRDRVTKVVKNVIEKINAYQQSEE